MPSSSNFHDLHGGGLFNAEILTVTNSTIYGNTGELGSGISNGGGTATVISSTISNNTWAGSVVRILSDGMLTVRHSIVAGNFVQNQEFGPPPPPTAMTVLWERHVTSRGHTISWGKIQGLCIGPGDLTVESDAMFSHTIATVMANHGGRPKLTLLRPFQPGH